MNSQQFFLSVEKELKTQSKGYLLTVVRSEDSSPGRAGFKMGVFPDNTLIGTIGGGVMEKNLVDKALTYLSENRSVNELYDLLHNNAIPEKSSGLICSGSQSIALNYISLNELPVVQEINNCFKNKTHKKLIISNTCPRISIKEPLIIEEEYKEKSDYNTNTQSWIYTESVGNSETIYIIGGGHVGLALSQIMSFLGFYTVVIDERDEISSIKNNTFANEIIISPYTNIVQHIQNPYNGYAVIVTHNHQTDLQVLTALINADLKYLGLMGSKSKIRNLLDSLREKGYSTDKISGIHAPIGLKINSKTPEEIAISIAAQIIQIKNQD